LAANVAGIAINLHQITTQVDRSISRRLQVAKLLAHEPETAESNPALSTAQLRVLAEHMQVHTSLRYRLGFDEDFVQRRVLRTEVLLADMGSLAAMYESPPFVIIEHASSFYRANLPLGLYDSDDVDLLSSPDHVELLANKLRALGYRPDDDSHKALRRIFLRPHPGGAPLEIVVWLRPLARNHFPAPNFLPFDDILEIAESVDSAWGRVPLLPPTYDLLYHCLHSSLHAYLLSPGLRIYLDIERTIAHSNIDWEEFTRFARVHRLATRVAVALEIAQALLSADVQPSVIRGLRRTSGTVDTFVGVASKLALYPGLSARFPRFASALVEGFIKLVQIKAQISQK
jgi:hypothetical protein